MHRAIRGHSWQDINYQVAQLTDLFADSVQWTTKPERAWRPEITESEEPAPTHRRTAALKTPAGHLSLREHFARATEGG